MCFKGVKQCQGYKGGGVLKAQERGRREEGRKAPGRDKKHPRETGILRLTNVVTKRLCGSRRGVWG